MSISTAQIRGARGLLDWSQAELSRRTNISTTSIGNIESGNTQARESTLSIIRKAFEGAGIEFLEGGVRHRDNLVTIIEQKNESDLVYLKLMDDVFYTLKDSGGELLLSFVDNSISPEPVVDRQMILRKAGIKMRFLVRHGSEFLRYPVEEYRYLPEGYYDNSPCLVYGDKVGVLVENSSKIIIINDKNYADIMRKNFEIIWSLGQKVPTGAKPKVKESA